MSLPNINIERAVGAERTGYGKYGFELERALERSGNLDKDSSLRIIVAPPYALKSKRKGEEVWASLMFEATRLPESFLEAIDSFAGLIVPNEYNLKQFGEEHPNVHLAPLGVDPEVWKPQERTVGDTFRVAFLGRSPRKGGDIAKPIFDLAFPDSYQLDPRPVFVHEKAGGSFNEEDFVAFVGGLHVVLGPSRGEGWNLMPFEALATGCPIVVSDIPGHAGFSHLPGCYTAPTELEESWLGGAGTWWAGYWWKPDIEKMAAQLRGVYDDYAQACTQARRGARIIGASMTWDHTAKAVLDAVGPLERLSMASLPDGDESLNLRRWEVDILKPVENANIGPKVLNFPVGKASLTADQLRVLVSAGYVDQPVNFMKTWEEHTWDEHDV